MDRHRKVEIVLVEDNPGDVGLIRLALGETGLNGHLTAIGDGARALAFARQEGAYRSAPRPDLIVLDLNLPGVGGREILRALKADPALRAIPVVVLTSSGDERDVAAAYAAGANAYVVKPLELDRFLAAIGELERFWLTTATLPTSEDGAPPD